MPRRLDLLKDRDETARILIDGESLLLEACCSSRVELQQPLTVIYWVESLLAKLQQRGGRFVVVFFRRCAATEMGLHSVYPSNWLLHRLRST